MDQDHENLVIELTAYLQSFKNRSLTSEELAILLVQDVVGPKIDEVKDRFIRIAYASVGATFPI